VKAIAFERLGPRAKANALKRLFYSDVQPAVFTADRRAHTAKPSVSVYPLKAEAGFAWLIWHDRHGAVERAGQTARRTEPLSEIADGAVLYGATLREAAMAAVTALLDRDAP
jgi:hypothetical protein